jgi:competence protein ComEC
VAGVPGALSSAFWHRLDAAVDGLGPAAWLARALLLGDRAHTPGWAAELFRQSGTAHILALSGMHLGILVGLIVLLLGSVAGRRRATVAAVVPVGIYVALIGFRASLARAALMFGLAVAALVAGRRVEPGRILGASFVVLAVAAPRAVDGLSFQLSFAALAGILVFGRWLDRALLPWLPALIRRPLAASVGAQLATLPLVIMAFGVARPVGIPATLVMAPLAALFLWMAVLGVGAGFVVPGAGSNAIPGLPQFLTVLEGLLLRSAELFARAPGVWVEARLAPVVGAVVVGLAAVVLRADHVPAVVRRPLLAEGGRL